MFWLGFLAGVASLALIVILIAYALRRGFAEALSDLISRILGL